MCHSLLFNLHWEPGKTYVQPTDTSDLQLAVGNNTAQALSALLAHQSDLAELDHLEEILNVLQLGLLPHFEEPGGLGAVEEKLHLASFSPTAAPTIWLVKPTQRKNGANASQVEQALPDAIAQQLDRLNVQQLGYNRLLQELESRQAQLFVDWHKYMVLAYPGDQSPVAGTPTEALAMDDVRRFLEAECAVIAGADYQGKEGVMGTLVAMANTLQQLKQTLENDLASLALELVPVQGPRYWQGADPVLLLAGADVQAHQRHGSDGRFHPDGYLHCRLSSQLVTEMEIHDGDTVTGAVKATDLPELHGPEAPVTFTTEIAALLTEALLLTPAQATFLAQVVGSPESVTAIQAVQNQLLSGEDEDSSAVTFTGQMSSPVGYTDWGGQAGENPWVPLMMQWEAYYDPILPIKQEEEGRETSYPSDFITHNFAPDDAAMPVELVAKNPPPEQRPSLQRYQGVNLLTPNTEINLRHQLQTFVKNYPEDPHVAELNDLLDYPKTHTLPRQSQVLSGLHAALNMRKQNLQLPVFDPLALKSGPQVYRFQNQTLPFVISRQNQHAPLPGNYFNPLRAGYMKISKVRIIDAFGQVKELENPPTMVAQSLHNPAAADPELIALPPRITQPSRLLFRWIAAADDSVESNSHPATTPIFGWVLFNHLDASLAIYTTESTALGAFSLRGPKWLDAPGNGVVMPKGTPNAALDQLADTPANRHLRNFVLGIFQKLSQDNSTDYLTALLAAIDLTVTNIDPTTSQQQQDLAVLMGRPLALTRASLKLEIKGLPALDQSWAAFQRAVTAGTNQYAERDMAGFADLKFPVQLGDLSNVQDGLVGYFVTNPADDSPAAYTTFYAPAISDSDQQGKGVEDPGFDHLQLRPSFGQQTTTENGMVMTAGQDHGDLIYLTMLIDPRAKIHATTGILPTKAIEIPSYLFNSSVQHIAVTFLNAPLLRSQDKLAIPLPTEPGYEWSWIKKGATTWETTKDIAKINQKAGFSYPPTVIEEGWLQLQKQAPTAPEPAEGRSPAHANLMLTNWLAAGRTGLSSQQRGLAFSLENVNQDPVIFITDDPDLNQLKLHLINLSERALSLKGGKSSISDPQHSTAPSSFWLSVQGFLSTEEFKAIEIAADGWHTQYVQLAEAETAYWVLSPQQDLVLAAQASIHFTIRQLTAEHRPRMGSLTIDHYQLPLPDASDQIKVFLQRTPDPNRKNLRLQATLVQNTLVTTVDPNQPITNTLELHLTNPDPGTPLVDAATPWGSTPPLFHLTFPYGDQPGHGAFTSATHARNVELRVADHQDEHWQVRPKTEHDDPYWWILPEKHHVLGTGKYAKLVLQLSNIISPTENGPTVLYLQHANLPGYNDGLTTLVLQKQPASLTTNNMANSSIFTIQLENDRDAKQRGIVFITSRSDYNQLRVVIRNESGEDLQLKGGKPVAREAVTADSPATFYLDFGALFTEAEFRNLKISAEGWQAAYFDGNTTNFALSPTADTTLAATGDNQSISFTISGVTASNRPQPDYLTVHYANINVQAGDVPAGQEQSLIFLQNKPNPTYAELDMDYDFSGRNKVSITDEGDSPIPNKLSFYLDNQTTKPLVAEDTNWESNPPVFNVFFVYGTEDAALTTVDLATHMAIAPQEAYADSWAVVPKTASTLPYWILKPTAHAVLDGTGGANATVVFNIEHIVTYLAPGLTSMYIQYANIPNYNDGFVSLMIEKVRAPRITALEVDPAWLESSQGPLALTVKWEAKNFTSLTLRTEIAGAPYTEDVTDKESWTSPLAVDKTTRFTLTANANEDDSVELEVPFEIVDYQWTANAFDFDVNQVMDTHFRKFGFHSPQWDRLYILGSGEEEAIVITVLDTSSLQVIATVVTDIKLRITDAEISPAINPSRDRLFISASEFNSVNSLWVVEISQKGEVSTALARASIGPSLPRNISLSADGKKIYFDPYGAYITTDDFKVYDLKDPNINNVRNPMGDLIISPLGDILYSIQYREDVDTYSVLLYDVIRREEIATLSTSDDPLPSFHGITLQTALTISPDGTYLYLDVLDRHYQLSLKNRRFNDEGENGISLIISNDGRTWYYSGTMDGNRGDLVVYTPPTDTRGVSYFRQLGNLWVKVFAISPDDRKVYVFHHERETENPSLHIGVIERSVIKGT